MDARGILVVDDKTRDLIRRALGREPEDVVLSLEVSEEEIRRRFDRLRGLEVPLLEIASRDVVVDLAGMNRAQRLVYRSERRRGASETEAIDAARASLPR